LEKEFDDTICVPLVSWNKICKIKKVGGLGLRKIEIVNSVFLKKLTWKLFHEQNLLVKQMNAQYLISGIFLMLIPKNLIHGHGNAYFKNAMNCK